MDLGLNVTPVTDRGQHSVLRLKAAHSAALISHKVIACAHGHEKRLCKRFIYDKVYFLGGLGQKFVCVVQRKSLILDMIVSARCEQFFGLIFQFFHMSSFFIELDLCDDHFLV